MSLNGSVRAARTLNFETIEGQPDRDPLQALRDPVH
jgi:hypothetical protein